MKKINVLFICHGNICRSPMAEFVFKDMVQKKGYAELFHIESAATSTEEIGNPVHRGTVRILSSKGISCSGKRARQITIDDYEDFDFLIGMDRHNMINMKRILGEDTDGKMHLLLDFTERKGDIADPWYTNNFELTYRDVLEGCEGFLSYLHFSSTSFSNFSSVISS